MSDISKKILKIIISFILLIIVILIDQFNEFTLIQRFFLYLIPYIVSSIDSFNETIEKFKDRNIFNENFLMILASLGAMLMCFVPKASNMFLEGIFVMLFFEVGELFEMIAEGKSEKSIKSLMEIRPDYANLLCNGKVNKVDPSTVKVEDIILIYPGEKVPLDGIIKKGTTYFNTVNVTGESVPRKAKENDYVYSGFVNQSGVIEVVVKNTFNESTASKIIELVKNANSKKSNKEKFITKFSKFYTPIVIFLSILIIIVFGTITSDYITWIKRGLNFLIVSCPCALVISVPLAYFGGIGSASKKGILFKGANYLETMAKVNVVMFDKTGTLTKGIFDVLAVHPNEVSENTLLHIAAHIEKYSTHPIAISILDYYDENNLDDKCVIENIKEIAGYGMSAKVNKELLYVGNAQLMDKYNIDYLPCEKDGTVIHVASKKRYYGHIVISDEIKSDSKEIIEYLNNNNIKVIMLTGDKEEVAKSVSKSLKIKNYVSELLPQDKVRLVEKEIENNNSVVSFIGDGINDAAAISRSDIGISMGKIASEAAIDSSDVVFMNDTLGSIIDAINISKKTNVIVKENITLSICVKLITLILSIFGFVSIWMAIFADVGITIVAILNSIRTIK